MTATRTPTRVPHAEAVRRLKRWEIVCTCPMTREAWRIQVALKDLLAKVEEFSGKYDGTEFDQYLTDAGVPCDGETWGNMCRHILTDITGMLWPIEAMVSILGGELPGNEEEEPKPITRSKKPR